MEPKAYLPSNTPWANPASVIPPTPADAGPVAGGRRLAPKAAPTTAQLIEWIDIFLHANPNAPRKQRLDLIKQRHQHQLALEAAELQVNPVAEEELRLIAARLARKAQSGFGGPPAADNPTTSS